MDKKQLEVYNYYKRAHPNAMVLYRIGDNYVALGDDAVTLRNRTACKLEDGKAQDVFAFPDKDFDAITNSFEETTEIVVVRWVNDAGELDFPDIQAIEKGKDEDY